MEKKQWHFLLYFIAVSQPDSTAITSFDTDTEQGLDLIIIIIIALAVAVSLLIGVIIIAIIVTITVCIIAKKRRQTRQQSSSSSQSEPHNYESYPGPPTPPYYARPLPLHNQDNTADIATGYSEAGHSETSFARNPAYIRMNKTTDYENIPYYTQIIDQTTNESELKKKNMEILLTVDSFSVLCFVLNTLKHH